MNDYDFMLSEEQIELRDMIRDFSLKKVRPKCKVAEINGEIPEDLVKEAIDMDLNLVTLPEEYGGLGFDKLTYAVIREQLAYGDTGFASRVFGFGFDAVNIAGNQKQKDMVADIMLQGGVTAFALTESDSGSNAGAMKTTAIKDGNDYIINGSKTFITNGDTADIITIFAVTDAEKGTKGGITAFLLPKDTKGFSTGIPEEKMGLRCVHTNDLHFDDVRLSKDLRLGEEGEGYKIAMQILDESRPVTASSAIGISQAALDIAIDYAKQRSVFGKPIIKHQGIGFMLADMEIQTQAARQMVWGACKSADAGRLNKKLSAMGKCFAGDTVMRVTTDAVQVLGGYGYSKEYPVEKLMRDAKIYQIFEGTNQIQRIVISTAQRHS